MSQSVGWHCSTRRLEAGLARGGLALLASVALVLIFSGLALAAPLGQITEFSAGLQASNASYPNDIAPGPDGNLWFTDEGSTPAIGQITTSGQITEFSAGLQASNSSYPNGIAPGPDGNVWFTDNDGTFAIGRITPNGTINEFSNGLQASNASRPGDIAAGPDGNLWFIDGGNTEAIGRITPQGTITEFSTGLQVSNHSVLGSIAAGPDGNLWFTDDGGGVGGTNEIGRITPQGTITEYSTGLQASNLSSPQDITAGPDGNMWFTDTGGTRAIGKITPTGTITEYSTGLQASNASFPIAIAPGPDGNLWFIDNGGTRAIGQITPNGTITEYSTGLQASNASRPTQIAPGPDGNLWFTDPGATKEIGQIGAGASAASVSAPSVTGSGRQGTQQTCAGATWSTWAGQQPSLNTFGFDGYRWLLDGSAIAGQANQTYTPTSADIGHQLSCRVTGTYPLLEVTVSATSAAVTVRRANGTQSISWSIVPSKLPKTTYKPVKLTFTARISPQTGEPADQPASDVKLIFPNDIKFNAKGIEQCHVSTLASGHHCPRQSVLGGGSANFYSPLGNITPPVTAYNGVTSSHGTPTIILTGMFPPSKRPIVGTLSTNTGGTIDFAIPAFGGGKADLTYLTIAFSRPGYASARCSTKKLTLKSRFTYAVPGSAGAPQQSPSETITCEQS